MSSTLKLYKDRLYEHVTTGLWQGWLPSTQPAIEKLDHPTISWSGTLIPYQIWCQAVALSRASYTKNKSECQWKFLYNEDTHAWEICVLPQEAIGMTTKEIAGHPDREGIISDYMSRGFQIVGTGHHHCSSSAFQSGTDSCDEENIPGFHFTVGYVDKKTIDVHMRITFRGDQYIIEKDDIPSWFAVPLPENLPEELNDVVRKHMVLNPPSTDIPSVWLDRIHEKTFGGNGNGFSRQSYLDDNDYVQCKDGMWRRFSTLSKAEQKELELTAKKADRAVSTRKQTPSKNTIDETAGSGTTEDEDLVIRIEDLVALRSARNLEDTFEFQALTPREQMILRSIRHGVILDRNDVAINERCRVVRKGITIIKEQAKQRA